MPDSSILTLTEIGFEHSPELGELAAALALAQGQIEGAKKDSTNPFFGKTYADLASVWAACRKPLTDNGLSVLQAPVGVGTVTTMLLHKSGQWVRATCTADSKDHGPQAIGSVLTYLRRYALSGFAGVPQIDDDGNAGQGSKTNGHASSPPVQAVRPVALTPTRQPGDEPDDPFGDLSDPSDPTPTDAYLVTEVREKRGESPKGPWTLYIVRFSDGREASTFDVAVAAMAKAAIELRTPMAVTVTPGKKAGSLNLAHLEPAS